MKPFLFLFLFSIGLTSLMTSCSKDKEDENEEELITDFRYTLTPIGGGEPVVFSFFDSDGPGGIAPIIVNGKLKSGTEYNASITLLNTTEIPFEDITEEVETEAEEHQFFFGISNSLKDKLQFTYLDKDSNNRPLGLKTKVSAVSPGKGNLLITLRHEPNKAAEGVSTGNITNAGGETDIEIAFEVEIQ